jgi:hypothetical protein
MDQALVHARQAVDLLERAKEAQQHEQPREGARD